MAAENVDMRHLLRAYEGQEWVASTAQLRAAGVGDGAIAHGVRAGRLHRMHRGVFALGRPDVSARGRCWAAVLACGGPEDAALSHGWAAALWDLRPWPAGPIDVTTLRSSHSTPRIRVHCARTLEAVTQPDGLPVTTVTRTLLDLALILDAHRLERLCHRAEELRLGVDPVAPGRRGARRLREALATVRPAAPDITRSELEERFLALVARNGLPRPLVNARVDGREVDFFWPAAGVIVETDGAATHLTARAFEADRARDAELGAAGYRVIRFTWRQICDRPRWVARTLGEILTAS
jgi:hypothetical protein